MNILKTTIHIIIIPCFLCFIACTPSQKEPRAKKGEVVFSGIILDLSNEPISEVVISVNRDTVKTDENGEFNFSVEPQGKYVFSAFKFGYGLLSRVYFEGKKSVWRLKKATIRNFDPTQDIVLVDEVEDCPSLIDSAKITFASEYAKIPMVFNSSGQLESFELPPSLQDAYKTLANRTKCNSRASIRIRANSLVRSDGIAPTGDIDLAISTIDIFSDAGMPGDYSVTSEREGAYMVSLGAASVEASFEGEPLNLRKGESATLTIPVDPTILESTDTIPDIIPFLVYNRQSGEWEQEGEAKLNRELMEYVKEVTHFSEFNFDIVKTGGSCIHFNAETLGPGTKKLRISIPGDVVSFQTRDFDNPGSCTNIPDHHALRRLPNDTYIGVVMYEEPTPGNIVITANYAWNTGGPGDPTVGVDPCDYTGCGTEVNLMIQFPIEPVLVAEQTPTDVTLTWVFGYNNPTDPTNEWQLDIAFFNSGIGDFDPYGATDADLNAGILTSRTQALGATQVKYRVGVKEGGAASFTYSNEVIITP